MSRAPRPESVSAPLVDWYRRRRRDLPWRRSGDPYAVWVSEVMLQQTQVRTAIPYFERFMERFPTVTALADANDDDVMKAWEGLGYYARARNLLRAVRVCRDEHGGRVPDDPDTFGGLPGVGEYIRAAVQSIAFGHPLAAVDGNVKRVLARVFAEEAPVNHSSARRRYQELADAVLDPSNPSDHNQAMMELGALVCRPTSPACADCPLDTVCAAYASGRTNELPVRVARKTVPEYHVAVGVVENGSRLLITRRPDDGLLGGLWEFPGGKVRDGETPEQAVVREIREEVDIDVEVEGFIARVRHAYSHFKVEIDVYRCRYYGGEVRLNGPVDYRWIVREEIDAYAFPGANRKFIPMLTDRDA